MSEHRYFALGDPDRGRANVLHYYAWLGEETAALIANAVCGSADELKEFMASFEDLGADEMVFNPATDDPDEIKRLADLVL